MRRRVLDFDAARQPGLAVQQLRFLFAAGRDGATRGLGLEKVGVRLNKRGQVEVDDFTSTYYLVTRVAYSAMCQREGVAPDYEHPLHEIATMLPAVGRFSPIRLVDMVR